MLQQPQTKICPRGKIFFNTPRTKYATGDKMSKHLHVAYCQSVMRTFRCIYVNSLDRLRFLDEVRTKFQKIHFIGQFQDHNSGRKHGNQTNDPMFSSNFSLLTVCNIYFCIFENSQSSFSCSSPFGPFLFWSITMPQFWAKATDLSGLMDVRLTIVIYCTKVGTWQFKPPESCCYSGYTCLHQRLLSIVS